MNTKQNSSLYILITIGIISALGPFVTDFYLPAFPALASYFGTSASMIQLTLTVSMAGLAIGQLFIGPLSDRYGRKIPLVASLVLFIIATTACLVATTIGEFMIFRFMQGIAGAGGVVISKSIATDLYKGKRLVRFFSMLSSVQGLAPICAPVLGGVLLTVTDWQGIFWTLLFIGVALLLALLYLKESIRNKQADIWTTFRNYVPVMHNRNFMRYALVQAMSMGVMFSYIAASPFIFQEYYGLSPIAYSICFGVNALGIMSGSLLVIRFKTPEKALLLGTKGFLLMGVITALTLICNLPVCYVETALFILLVCLGLILPTSTTLSLQLTQENSGSASAILGFLTFLAGGICSPLTGIGHMQTSTALIIIICAACTALLAHMKNKELTEPVKLGD